MNILILTNNFVGLYNFRRELITALVKDNKVTCALPYDPRKSWLQKIGCDYFDIPVDRRGINPFADLRLLIDYIIIIKKVNPDIVLTYTIKPNIYGTFAARIYKKPVIMNITGLGSSFRNGMTRKIVMRLYKYACHMVNLAFFQNEDNRSFFIENKIIDNEKTKLIPGSGVNITKFKPLLNKRQDEIIKFLFIGRIMKEKGIEEYLEVAEQISQSFLNVEFQILGPFEEMKYKNIIDNIKNKKIVYLGISQDVRNEIKEADCIINPSYHEGMSNVLLEGAAMGKPLIASNIPGCKEIIRNGYNGYLFEVGSSTDLKDKIFKFIKLSKKEKEVMGMNSRKIVETEFDRNIIIDEYINAINNILNKR